MTCPGSHSWCVLEAGIQPGALGPDAPGPATSPSRCGRAGPWPRGPPSTGQGASALLRGPDPGQGSRAPPPKWSLAAGALVYQGGRGQAGGRSQGQRAFVCLQMGRGQLGANSLDRCVSAKETEQLEGLAQAGKWKLPCESF